MRGTIDHLEVLARKKYFRAVGKYLREKREQAGVTRQEIAEASRCSPQFVSNIERGAAFPPMPMLRAMTRLYRLDEHEFLDILMTMQHDFFKAALFQASKRRA